MAVQFQPYSRVTVPEARKVELRICHTSMPIQCLNINWIYRCSRYECHIPNLKEISYENLQSAPRRTRKGASTKNWPRAHGTYMQSWDQIQNDLFGSAVHSEPLLLPAAQEDEEPQHAQKSHGDEEPLLHHQQEEPPHVEEPLCKKRQKKVANVSNLRRSSRLKK